MFTILSALNKLLMFVTEDCQANYAISWMTIPEGLRRRLEGVSAELQDYMETLE